MPTITKKELIKRIAEQTQTKQEETKAVIQCFLEQIMAELSKNNRLEFRDFGVFDVRTRAARIAQNPRNLTPVQVPATRRVKFKMSRFMKLRLNRQSKEEQ